MQNFSETITGKLKKIIYRNLDSDFIIAAFISSNISQDDFIATGSMFKPSENITYSMEGKWTEHHKFGKQFSFSSYCIVEPVDIESIIAFLEKHISGIGPAKAKFLAKKYKKHTIRILKNAPERVSDECKGISYNLAKSISEQLQEDDKRQEVLIKLEGLFKNISKLPKNLAESLIKIHGLSAFDTVKNNPYILTDINRVGFLLADKVALLSCQVAVDDKMRIQYGILYAINQIIQNTGNVWLTIDTIFNELSTLVVGLKINLVIKIIQQLIDDEVLAKHNKLVTLMQLSDDENTIADCVIKFLM